MSRWAQHLISNNELKSAVFVYISLRLYSKAIQTLSKYDIEKSAILSSICIKRQLIDVQQNRDIFDHIFHIYSKKLENSCLDKVIDGLRQLLEIKA